jgi:tripartite-type tricarboxylate transporter receptor subunit TctC
MDATSAPEFFEPVMSILRRATLLCAIIAVLLSPAHAEDFYRGKTLTILVGYAVGGGYDTNARLVSRHIGRHIPGNPTVLVANMPGAGSLRAIEHLERTAPRDGTAIMLFDFTQITNSLLTPNKVPKDFRRFSWIGSVAQDLAVCYVWNSSVPARTLAEVQRLPVVHMGRTNSGSSSDINQKIFRKFFNVNVHSIAGYAGSMEAFLAVERGELNGGCLTWSSLPPQWITEKKITPILRLASGTAPDLPETVPSALDVAASDRDRQIIRVLTGAADVGKPFVTQQSVPDVRVRILRESFAETMKDPLFLADAERQRQPVSPVRGEDAAKILEQVYGSPADIIEAARIVASD